MATTKTVSRWDIKLLDFFVVDGITYQVTQKTTDMNDNIWINGLDAINNSVTFFHPAYEVLY